MAPARQGFAATAAPISLAARHQREHWLLRQYFPKGSDLSLFGAEDRAPA
jgi:hypothetical protein